MQEKLKHKFDQDGVREFLKQLMDLSGISEFEFGQRGGVQPSTIYGILKSKSGRVVRRSTIRKLAEGVGYKVSFDTKENLIIASKVKTLPMERNMLTVLAEEVNNLILTSDRKDLSQVEAERIKGVVRLLLNAG